MCTNITDWITAIATAGTFLVAFGGVFVGIYRSRQQHHLNFYEKYTKRCSDIMKLIPTKVLYEENKDKPHHNLCKSEVFTRAVFLYFDLCSEEYYLAQNGYIEEKVWSDWKEGMQAMFNKPSINHQLQMIKDKFADAYPNFIDFLKYELQIKNL